MTCRRRPSFLARRSCPSSLAEWSPETYYLPRPARQSFTTGRRVRQSDKRQTSRKFTISTSAGTGAIQRKWAAVTFSRGAARRLGQPRGHSPNHTGGLTMWANPIILRPSGSLKMPARLGYSLEFTTGTSRHARGPTARPQPNGLCHHSS